MQSWQVKEAKARFSELLRDAAKNGPQEITVRGRRTAVVLSVRDYDRLNRPRTSLTEFLRASPLAGIELDLERASLPARAFGGAPPIARARMPAPRRPRSPGAHGQKPS